MVRPFQGFPSETSPIIVKFTSRSSRDIFFEARKKLKSITIIGDFGYKLVENSKNKIFVNESLTINRKKLFGKTREACTSKRFKYTWTRNGTIYVKKDKKSQTIKIMTENDIYNKIR